MTEEEFKVLKDAIQTGSAESGPIVRQLEKHITEYVGLDVLTEHTCCLDSASAALELILRVAGIARGDEVIIPAYCHGSVAAAVSRVGATVKLIDSQRNSFEMDYDAMEQAITRETKAIIAVDIDGIVCDYERIFEAAANRKKIFKPAERTPLGYRIQRALKRPLIVADSAHAFGAARNGVRTGAIADFTAFSFHSKKRFTRYEGGAACWRRIKNVEDYEIYRQFRIYSGHGLGLHRAEKEFLYDWEYDIDGPWDSCGMSDMMAAVRLKQFEHISEDLSRRREIIGMYDGFCRSQGYWRQDYFTDKMTGAGHFYLTKIPDLTVRRRTMVLEAMAARGVNAAVHYKPLPLMSRLKSSGWNVTDCPGAYIFYHNELSLPVSEEMSDADVKHVLTSLRETVDAVSRTP